MSSKNEIPSPQHESRRSRFSIWSRFISYLVGVFFHSFFVSLLVHGILMLVLVNVYLPGSINALREMIFQPGLSEGDGGLDNLAMLDTSSGGSVGVMDNAVPIEVVSPQTVMQPSQVSGTSQLVSMSSQPNRWSSPTSSLTTSSGGSGNGTAFDGRGDGKGFFLAQHGGSEGSEKAVALGLEWLAAHQNQNGSWDYDFRKCPKCKGKCGNPGWNKSQNSATALALLPFLGCGVTHKQGKAEYRPVVDKGLKFLLKNSVLRQQGRDFMDVSDGGMYHQGLVSIAICEAAAMSQDPKLMEAAQQAVDFICYAQIPSDGGWRYQPRDRSGGDTSVVGWQIMALKSGQMGGARVPNEVFFKARRFLDTVVGIDKGAMYGYQSSKDIRRDNRATSSIGLLSQMYLGWSADNPSLIQGVEYLSAKGPDPGNLYYNYYATQVMHHFGGEAWTRWNKAQRDSLIARQSQDGHQRGSWYFEGEWNDRGGRLYTTSLSILILEVYYRHLPLFRTQATETEFPLD